MSTPFLVWKNWWSGQVRWRSSSICFRKEHASLSSFICFSSAAARNAFSSALLACVPGLPASRDAPGSASSPSPSSLAPWTAAASTEEDEDAEEEEEATDEETDEDDAPPRPS